MTSKVIATEQVKVQASPIPSPGLTPLKVYSAIAETTEYTYELDSREGVVIRTSTDTNYVVVDDNGDTFRFGNEFFRQVED